MRFSTKRVVLPIRETKRASEGLPRPEMRGIGAGGNCLRLLLAAIQLANRVGANLPDRVLHGRGLLAFAVFALLAAANERAFDQT